MTELNKLQAKCKHCNKDFVLPMAVIDPEYLLNNPGLLQATQFFCTFCNQPNTFTVEEVGIID